MNRAIWWMSMFSLLPLAVAHAQPAAPGTNPPTNSSVPAVPVRAPVAPLPFLITRLDPAMDLLLAPEAELNTIVTIPNLASEGPQWRDGKLWFSDQRSGRIYAVSIDGSYSVVMENAGGPIDPKVRVLQGPNGEITAKDGGALIARQGLRDIGHLDRNGVMSAVISDLKARGSIARTTWFIAPTEHCGLRIRLSACPASAHRTSTLLHRRPSNCLTTPYSDTRAENLHR